MFWIIVGDVHENPGNIGRIPDIGRAEAVVLTGDLTNRGREPQAQAVLERVRAANPSVLALQGNMDHAEVGQLLARQDLDLHRGARLLAPGLVALGVGWSTPTPFGTPSEVDEDVLAAWLDEAQAMALALAPGAAVLAVIHNPPQGTALDRLPGGRHVGSRAVRAFIERTRPAVAVCGHIHEAYGEDRIGPTRLFNPGLLAEGGYVRLDFADGRLEAALERV